MNTNTNFVDHSKKILLALLTVSSVGIFTDPAQADNAVIQESIQESVITGQDNVSVQNSNQSNHQHTEYRDRYSRYHHSKDETSDNTGIVQRSDQYCDQVGEYNTCVQDAQQSNRSTSRRSRRNHR